MVKRYGLCPLEICLIISVSVSLLMGLSTNTRADEVLKTPLTDSGTDLTIGRDLATAVEIFEQAGFSKYFEELGLLWTENDKARSALSPLLSIVPDSEVRHLQSILVKILQSNPHELKALVLAGQCEYFQNQKQAALIYFERTLQLSPRYEPAALGLADLLLAERQPQKALQTIKELQSPEALLRKGSAYLQLGEYQLALGYLLQADLYSGEFSAVRNKELAKVLLATGDVLRAQILLEREKTGSRIGQILLDNLRITATAMKGDFSRAQQLLEKAKTIYPHYELWDFYTEWFQLQTGDIPLMDHQLTPDYRAALMTRLGQHYLKKNFPDAAYQVCLEAIKTDRHSLVSYLEGGAIQLKKKNYQTAVKLFSRGLEINPQFVPLLAKRAEAYEKMKDPTEAAKDRTAIHSLQTAPPSKFLLNTFRTESGETYINFRNDLDKLNGLWYSTNGSFWLFTAWQGVTVSKNINEIWLLPVGPGISGEAIHLKLNKVNLKFEPSITVAQTIQFRLPFKARIIMEQTFKEQLGSGYVNQAFRDSLQIPTVLFGKGPQDFRVWYGLEDGSWLTRVYSLTLGDGQEFKKPQFHLTTERAIVSQRLVTLNIDYEGEILNPVRMDLGEMGHTSGWIPFKRQLTYLLSSGDGKKLIQARFFDNSGLYAEAKIELFLDTAPPQIKNFVWLKSGKEQYFLSWQSDGPATSKVRFFDNDGYWKELAVSENGGTFSTSIPLQSSYCQVILADSAGNTLKYVNQDFNRNLSKLAEVQFSMAHPNSDSSRIICLKPDIKDIWWSLSNDLSIWSMWYKGDNEVTWRTDNVSGEQLSYIRYRIGDEIMTFGDIQYLVIPVSEIISEK